MPNGEVVTFVCALLGFEGSPIEVEIDLKEYGGDLKDEIKAKTPEIISCDANNLTLWFATKGDEWLPWNDEAVLSLQQGEIHREIQDLIDSAEPLLVAGPLRYLIEAKALTKPSPRQIHILVKVPGKVPPAALNHRRG